MQNDMISRNELLKQFPPNMESPLWHFTGIRAAIEAAPAVDAVPVVHAGWEDQDYTFTRFQCTACKSMNHSIMTKYCPNCGARMDAKSEEDTDETDCCDG
jgi:hypothetical protein